MLSHRLSSFRFRFTIIEGNSLIGYPVRIAGYHGIVSWWQDILHSVVGVSKFISDDFFMVAELHVAI